METSRRDIIQPDLRVLFCGINPGKSSTHNGFHFAHPANRFWKTIFQAGFTRTQLKPEQEHQLLDTGCGITTLVERPTVMASELADSELRNGGQVLWDKVKHYQPAVLAVLGKKAYQQAFRRSKVAWGRQPELIGQTEVWVLPNPSGLNRASQEEMTAAYAALEQALSERGL